MNRKRRTRLGSAPVGFFLGLLHMEVIKERLEREFDLDLLATAPSVEYHVFKSNGEMLSLHSPQDMPDASEIDHIEEPYLKAKILIPPDYVGAVMDLTVARRGNFITMNYLSTTTVEMLWEIPLSELIMDYFDQLKSRTKGYASLDYDFDEYKTSKLVKLDILLAGKPIDALSFIVHNDKAYARGKVLVEKLKGIIPRQDVRDPHSGCGRVTRALASDRACDAQGRARQMLWRRHHA